MQSLLPGAAFMQPHCMHAARSMHACSFNVCVHAVPMHACSFNVCMHAVPMHACSVNVCMHAASLHACSPTRKREKWMSMWVGVLHALWPHACGHAAPMHACMQLQCLHAFGAVVPLMLTLKAPPFFYQPAEARQLALTLFHSFVQL